MSAADSVPRPLLSCVTLGKGCGGHTSPPSRNGRLPVRASFLSSQCCTVNVFVVV